MSAPSSVLSLARAHAIAASFADDVRRAGLPIDALLPLGGLRRYAPEMAHVVLLAVAPDDRHAALVDALASIAPQRGVRHRATSHVVIATARGDVHVHLAPPALAGAALAWHTGAPAHVAQLQTHGARRGLHFHGGTLRHGATTLECPTEEAFYAHLELPYIWPELREGADEVARAARGDVPALVTRADLRGDLHCHTDWSDGRDTVEGMVSAAAGLGHQYLAITDHSERSASHRTLAPADIARQRQAVDAARAGHPGIHVLHGIEVDIMPDGTLDFPDDVLRQFDIVLASLHEHAGQTPDQLLARYLRAADHPLVSVLTHPANRVPGHSDGYPLDFDRLFAHAARTGTAVEIDGGPNHLDLDGALARRAAAAGATLVIDSDAHRTDALDRQLQFGAGTARRGWIQPAEVLNTRPLDEVLAFIAAKRARMG